MKVYKSNSCDVSRIDFCCRDMATDILLGVVKTTRWTDHPLVFRVGDYKLSHCGHCGAKIDGELFTDKSKALLTECQFALDEASHRSLVKDIENYLNS